MALEYTKRSFALFFLCLVVLEMILITSHVQQTTAMSKKKKIKKLMELLPMLMMLKPKKKIYIPIPIPMNMNKMMMNSNPWGGMNMGGMMGGWGGGD